MNAPIRLLVLKENRLYYSVIENIMLIVYGRGYHKINPTKFSGNAYRGNAGILVLSLI